MSSASFSTTSPAMSAPSFDPLNTPLNITTPEGPVPFTLGEIDFLLFSSLQTVIVYASQLGASLILLIALILLTKPDKRFSPIFVLNGLSLLLNFLRLLLKCLEYTGPLNEIYTNISGDYSQITMATLGVSIGSSTLSLLVVITLETSMALQVQVVCIDLDWFYRRIIFGVSAIVALLAIAFRFILVVRTNQLIVELVDQSSLDMLEAETLDVTAISVFYFAAVFITKLGYAIYKRRKLGLQKWGPMQVLFTMGCQTLILPAIFAIIQYCPTGIPDMQSNVLTAVALSLPLSSLWASSTIEGEKRDKPPFANREVFGAGATLPASSSAGTLLKHEQSNPGSSATNHSLETTMRSPAPEYTRFAGRHGDIELQS